VLANRFSFAGIRLAMRWLAALPVDTRSLLFRLCRWQPWVPELYRELTSGAPGSYDLVHVTNMPFDALVYGAYLFARRNGIPLVITPFLHLGEPGDETVRRYYTMPHQMTMLRDSQRVLVQTDLERNYLLSRGLSEERVQKVGVGIDPAELDGGQGERFRSKYQVLVGAPIVFTLGALAYDKGTVHLVEAMRRLWEQGCDAHLVLAGPAMGDFETYFRSLPESVRARCHMLGFISEEDKRDLLDAGDVFAMPSRTDSFGIVYLEAWWYKKPVIGARAGGVPDVIDDGRDGYLVPFGDVARLAEALGALLADRAKARQFGESGHQKTAGQYTWESKYASIKAIYQDLSKRPA